jgi:hypothetical protein
MAPALTKAQICQGCWQQMHVPIPIRGPLSLPLRVVGVKISQMHPNLCTICETMFTRVMRTKQKLIPAAVLFADLRGYTDKQSFANATTGRRCALHRQRMMTIFLAARCPAALR